MESIRVLLCCGAGFSSGFLAQKARQAAKKKGLQMTIDARSESVISEYLDKMDVLLIGPHYEASLEHLKTLCKPYHVPVGMIPASIYSTIDGEGLVELALSYSEKGGE